MHIFGRRAAKEAELRRQEPREDVLGARPASSRPLDAATRNLLRVVATAALDRTASARADALGVDATGVDAVTLLMREPGLSVGDLAARLDRSHSATVRVVERLEGAGLVERNRSRSDARRATLALSDRGLRLVEMAGVAADAAVDGLLAGLTSGERLLFQRILGQMVAHIPGGPVSGGRVCRNCDPTACGVEGCPRERLL